MDALFHLFVFTGDSCVPCQETKPMTSVWLDDALTNSAARPGLPTMAFQVSWVSPEGVTPKSPQERGPLKEAGVPS